MIKRIFVEKKRTVSGAAEGLARDLNVQLKLGITDARTFIRYDVEGLSETDFAAAVNTVFSEPPVDDVYYEELPPLKGYTVFAAEFLPGQYDMRADSAAQCVQLLTMSARPVVKCATVYAFAGLSDPAKAQSYLINPVDSRLAEADKPVTLEQKLAAPSAVELIEGFRSKTSAQIKEFHKTFGLAMSLADIKFVQKYFKKEGRDPFETEIKVLDTYWSDHCRHTTFLTELTDVRFDTPNPEIEQAYNSYIALHKELFKGRGDKYPCLMDIATIGARELKRRGMLTALDESEEINACSINVRAETANGPEDWLVMFKNETHNHPTEIEPFGGAATCLGGAIRDPLSGRVYVYHAMRVTGAADITAPVSKTLGGKLPQRVISRGAARGFSSYGNQIGLATGMVSEIYHPGYVAKRLETGFVVGAAPKANVVRSAPGPGDIVVLIGGETGRDGCGGATGSSKEHNLDSIEKCGAEVQKGNPTTERKIQRLFRNPEVTKRIKRCNDFGAGGVCVAIGELCDGLEIYLDRVPKKYEGLNGTELAISESQERMAVVISAAELDLITDLCAAENLTATAVAAVTREPRMKMFCGGVTIVDLKRSLLSSNGVKQTATAVVTDGITGYMNTVSKEAAVHIKKGDYAAALSAELKRLNVTCNKGLSEMFDSTVGAGSVLMPFGGERQLTPSIAMAAKLPVFPGDTDTATVAAWGFDPYLMSESPYVGAQYSILVSVAKVCAAGAPYGTVYLTLQEFFRRLKTDPKRWGEPLSALLGALTAQTGLGLAAIGGKDSMSGTFVKIDVPPTLISFALGIGKASEIIGNTLDGEHELYRIKLARNAYGTPDYAGFTALMRTLGEEIKSKNVFFATVCETGGAAAAIAKACLGNALGFRFANADAGLFVPALGDIIIAAKDLTVFSAYVPELLGSSSADGKFRFGARILEHKHAVKSFTCTLSKVFPLTGADGETPPGIPAVIKKFPHVARTRVPRPKVLIPVFPGTNCEYDTAKKFIAAGAETELFVVRNRTASDIRQTALRLESAIAGAQIIAFPGGFSGGDEPDGSGKFIATAFRSPRIADAVSALLNRRDGLIVGICNGFQALIKLGLLPFGEIAPMDVESATLYFNNVNRHVSALCRTRITSTASPWLSKVKRGEIYNTAVSHGEGRLIAPAHVLERLAKNGQIFSQY
ncbi:MAG: phosphoribosylformylglycinamidine synthase, partial [Clostridiales bacterium]|nr:phosphoribosylformylglycinamidine synthase [Clostridiales bacterium]